MLLRELINRAKVVVSQSVEPRRQEIKTRLDEIEKRRAELRASVESLRKRLRDAEASGTRGAGFDPLANQRREIEAELAAKRPRLQAFKQILPRVAAQGDEVGSASEGWSPRANAGRGAGEDDRARKGRSCRLLRARADLAEARVRVAEWGSNPSSSPSRNSRDELVNLEVDIAALEARLKALPAAEPVKPPAEDAQQLRSELFSAENENRTLEMQYRQVQRD